MSIAEKLVTIVENEQKVYKAGQKSEYDAFWDAFQENGNREYYDDAFRGICWKEEIFKPKYPLNNIKSAANMFNQTKMTNIDYDLDFTNATNISYAFAYSQIERIKSVKFGSSCAMSNAFSDAKKLTDLTVNGKIYVNASFAQSSLLTLESLRSIINALNQLVTRKTLKYPYGTYESLDVYCDAEIDPKGILWDITEASISGTTLTLNGTNTEAMGSVINATITVYGININKEDVQYIKTFQTDNIQYIDGQGFTEDITITIEKRSNSKTLSLHADSKALLTAEDIALIESKGWTLT